MEPNQPYKHPIGQTVYHREEPRCRGVVTQHLLSQDKHPEDVGTYQGTEPCCRIDWKEVPEGEIPYLGFEHQDQVVAY